MKVCFDAGSASTSSSSKPALKRSRGPRSSKGLAPERSNNAACNAVAGTMNRPGMEHATHYTIAALIFFSLLAVSGAAAMELLQVALAGVGAIAYFVLRGQCVPPVLAGVVAAIRDAAGCFRGDGGEPPPLQEHLQRQLHVASFVRGTAFLENPRSAVNSIAGDGATGRPQELLQDMKGFEGQVEDLVRRTTPTPEHQRVARQIADVVQGSVCQMFPGSEVASVAAGTSVGGTAFSVSVPEIDIVVTGSPHLFAQHMHGRFLQSSLPTARVDARKLQKSAIRACTDRLVAAGFKFRRCAFRGTEPRVTLVAPPSLGFSSHALPVNLWVNCPTPLRHAALVVECGRIDARARALILLVRRWAKDRGVCHGAPGHLQPYAWALLATHYLQAGAEGGPLLPPLQGFQTASGLEIRRGDVAAPVLTQSVADLFIGFLHYYAWKDWRKEAVSVRLGRAAPASLSLQVRVLSDPGPGAELAPSIEDPFEPARNLGADMTLVGLQRLREEFRRACSILAGGASLWDLLEPWAPPGCAAGGSGTPEGSSLNGAESSGEGGSAPAAIWRTPAAWESDARSEEHVPFMALTPARVKSRSNSIATASESARSTREHRQRRSMPRWRGAAAALPSGSGIAHPREPASTR